ncbi:aspartate/glutamate racemase family protein [Kurthia sibirica]|uniref:Aspartate racemase n=1 Tax=Kurthia sibirica TaxID=202750 RepID=A0A2U3AL84_9BACL|nr:amino acid racemase [Kurthia sibirica]PWI25272.1 aspartate racemase [Kurthia sibirica]GEK33778.1 aspartate racemase [Kurthia sibirica]
MNKKILGIIGGVGPLATMLLGEVIVRRTKASKDQEHMHFIIDNDTRIPDRTAFILDNTKENPAPFIIQDAGKLVSAGADVICIPCNTAHYFYEELSDNTAVPILHMIRETAKKSRAVGAKKIGILGTTGTLSTNLYQTALLDEGLEPYAPNEEIQNELMAVIYDYVKAGIAVPAEKWQHITNSFKAAGCDHLVLGCTELSVVYKELGLERDACYIDALMTLADTAIEYCGYEVIDLPQYVK